MKKIKTYDGWWVVHFDITLEGNEVDFDNLDEATQEHILKSVSEGFHQGQIIDAEYEGEI